MGPDDVVSSSIGNSTSTLGLNTSRLIYQSIDFSGLPNEIANLGNRAKAKLMEEVNNLTGFSLEVAEGNAQDQVFKYRDFLEPTEDTSWFGFGSLVILMPAVVMAIIISAKKKEREMPALIGFSLVFLPIETYLRWGWDPYQGRYFIAAVGVLAPAMVYLMNQKRISKIFQWLVLLVVLTSFSITTLFNPTKPLKSNDVGIFSADRAKLQSLAGGNSLWRFSYMINRTLPEDTVVAYYAPDLIYDYVLFGEHFTRKVIPIPDPRLLSDENWLKDQGIDCVLVDLTADSPYSLSQKWVPFDEVEDKWLLYTRSKINP